MSSKDKTLIADLMESFVSEVPANPFVSFCVACNKGVIKEEMTYEKGKVFHKDCYNKHGSSFPPVNQELQSESSNAKVQLIQLKNLKVRMIGVPNTDISQTKTTQKVKTQKPKRRITKKRKNNKKRKLKKRLTRKKLLRKKVKISKRKNVKKRISKRFKRKTRKRR